MSPVTVRVATSAPANLIAFGASAAVLLVGLLIVKELLDAYANEAHVQGTLRQEMIERISTVATAAIAPLAAVFGLAVVVKILEAL